VALGYRLNSWSENRDHRRVCGGCRSDVPSGLADEYISLSRPSACEWSSACQGRGSAGASPIPRAKNCLTLKRERVDGSGLPVAAEEGM